MDPKRTNRLFSIIIPTYNRATLIGETLESILGQTYENFEVLVIDDGSSDDTDEVVKAFSDPRILYYKKENEERAAARNFGLRLARGDYALFFDSDDVMYPDYIGTLNEKLETFQVPPFIIAAKYESFDGGRKWPSLLHSYREGWYSRQLLLKGNLLACNFCISLEAGGFSPFPEERSLAAMEDWLFLLLNISDEKKFYLIDKVCMAMREHEGRSMANNKKVIQARQKATEWALAHIDLAKGDKRSLVSSSAYFSSIHYYIEGNRNEALQQAWQAIKEGGFRVPFVLQIFKSIIGKRWIDRIK